MTSPSKDDLARIATPRPWEATTTPGFVTGYLRGDGRNIADMRYRNGHNDAALIVEAVNDYDRLRRIEAAARAIFIGWTPEGDGAYEALRAALDEEKPHE